MWGEHNLLVMVIFIVWYIAMVMAMLWAAINARLEGKFITAKAVLTMLATYVCLWIIDSCEILQPWALLVIVIAGAAIGIAIFFALFRYMAKKNEENNDGKDCCDHERYMSKEEREGNSSEGKSLK